MKARFFALAALVLGLASCQQDVETVTPVGGEVDFQLSVAAPELAGTRAGDAEGKPQNALDSSFGAIDYLQGSTDNDPLRTDWKDVDLRYTLEVYDVKNGQVIGTVPVKDRQVIIKDTYEPVVFDLRLVPKREYRFVVFADFVDNGKATLDAKEQLNVDGLHHTIGETLASITIKDDAINNEVTDAYFATKDIVIESAASQDIILKRPYGKVRVIATDLAELNLNVNPAAVEVKYTAKHPQTFDALTGEIGSWENVNYEFASVYNTISTEVDEGGLSNHFYTAGYDAEKVKNLKDEERHSHMTLFTDYILAEDQQTPINFTMTVYDKYVEKDHAENSVIKSTTFNTAIPVGRNKLTTVIGNVLTTATDVNVRIDDNFSNGTEWNPEEDEYDVAVWDGKSMTEPKKDTEGNYVVKLPSELAWLAAAVNGTLDDTRAAVAPQTFQGKTFKLTQDINLNNEEWTPIGNKDNKFQGTFDGQGHKIANLLITGNNNYVGLFGFTTDGEIKNLVVENAKVSGRNSVGVVAGSPYTSKFNDITVQGHVEVNGKFYVGGVGGRNAYANWNNVTVNVDETSYVNANSVEDGVAYRTYVGGVCGFNGEGGHSFKNITSNIDVKGSTIDVGGLFGIAHYGNQFENCSCSGNVEIYNAEEAEEAQEIGGIAGVWHNNDGQTVTMTNCTFTGTLKTNIAVDFYYGGLVGKPYSATGKGKLIIDGYEMVANGVGMKDGEYYMQSVAGLKWLAEQVNGGNNFSKKVVKLAADLDLNNEEWTPIGNSTYSFQGTFDGQDHKIANLLITGNKSNVGLFGFTTNGEIKNLVVENAKVSGYLNVAVVAGTPYTSKYTNITVQGHVEINGFAYVGAVGGKNAYADWTNVTVNVDETSYVNANSIEGSTAYRTYVGGVCGFNGEGGHSFTNITSNIDVKGSTIDVGGLFGIAHYGNQFENCSCSGDVEIYAAEEAVDAQEIGGIAGVWHNQNDTTVTMTNCTFTGKLKANIADVDFYYGGLVGKPYSETGTGILWLNGNKCLANGIIEDENGNLIVNSPESLEAALETAGAAGAGDTTIVIAENAILDMNNTTWTPIEVDGYHGAGIVTIEGNGAVITGLTAPLFAGGFAGGSGIVIKDLTIKDSNIVSDNTLGSGAFIESIDSMDKIELTNCHLLNSTVTGGAGSRTGGLIGWTAGYNNVNDGSVKTYVTIDNCSVIGCTIQCDGSVGGINGHAGNNAWTYTTIKNCTIENNTLNSTDDGGWRVGVVVGTANVGEVTISNITESGNTLTQTGKTAPEGFKRNYYGRFVPVTTGKLIIDGYEFVAEGLFKNENGDQIADSEAGLKEALKNGGTVVLANPFTIDQSESNGYGKTGINMTNGGTLDGNGNTLGAPGSTGTWDSAINTSGGTIKNITVIKGFRGIFIKKDTEHNEKLYLDNVTIDGTTYTISCDEGNGLGLEATNSTFKGWTSYAGTLGNAKFTDCYFGYGNGYSFCRPYAPTEFVGCEFEAGLTLDPRAAVTFENCTFGGVALTDANIADLVTDTTKVTIK